MAVLIKGKSIACSKKSRDHYLRGKENDRIAVRDVTGFTTKDPDLALQMIELSAKGTKCKKPLYSAKLNPEADRIWSKDEVIAAVELLEEHLGLKGHPRVVVEHEKKGRIHFHVLWSRVPPDGGAAKNMGNDYAAHQKTQRQLEKRFKLKPMMTRGRDFKQSEVEWAARYGFDMFKIREQITADFNKAKSGQQFQTMLETQGIVLCRGDKSQFVIILHWGQHKALSSMIHGRPTKAVLRRSFNDIDISKLPSVDEGKAIVKTRLPKAKPRAKSGTKSKSGHTLYIGRKPFQAVSHRSGTNQEAAELQKMLASHIRAEELSTETSTTNAPLLSPTTTIMNANVGDDQKLTPRHDIGDMDVPASRADLAYQEEFGKWVGLIDSAANDQSVSKEQRRANVASLRIQQRDAAKAAHKKVREEEQNTARAARRARRVLKLPPTPT